jgi:hypothetical protein
MHIQIQDTFLIGIFKSLLRLISCIALISLLIVGYFILPLLFYETMFNYLSSMGLSLIASKIVGLLSVLWILCYPLIESAVRCTSALIRAITTLSLSRF